MYTNNIFGNFYHIKSLMHDINPSIKIICFLISLMLILFTNALIIHIFIFVMIMLMILLTRVPIKNYVKIFYSLRYVYLFILIICGIKEIVFDLMITYILKVIIIFMYISLISYTTSISELSYGIERVLEAFNIFNLRLGNISFTITSILKFYPKYINNLNKCLKAQASRGIDYNHSNIKGRLFAYYTSFKPAYLYTTNEIKKTKLECKIRLFNINRKRTNINHNSIGFYDIILLTFHILFVFMYIIESGLL